MRNKQLERKLDLYCKSIGLELIGVDNVTDLRRLKEAKVMADEIRLHLIETEKEVTANHCYECHITVIASLATK